MFEKKFTLTIDVKEFPDESSRESVPITHFGLPWYLRMDREDDHLGVYLFTCRKKNEEKPWSVDATYEFRFISATGEIKGYHKESHTFCDDMGYGESEFVSWTDAMEDNTSKIVCNVTIGKTTGFATKRHRSFDEPKEHLTDVVLKVEDKKFHVLKGLLATHSSFFEALFFGKFDEAKQEEVELKDVDSDSFQSFLEILYGVFEITAHNVADLLILADKFDVQLVWSNCEKFLLANDQVSKKEKLCLADAFKLEDLMKDCLESMKTSDDIKANLPANLSDLSQPTVVAVLQKFLLLR